MGQIIKPYQLFVLLLGSLVGCNLPVEPDIGRLGYDYFPLVTGEERVYQVMEINYDGVITDTVNYQRKEIVGNSSLLNEITSYRLERFIRLADTLEWQSDSVWVARKTTYQAVVVENNLPIIKLSFPLLEDKRWDGNAMNTKEEDEFKIVNLGMTYQIDDTIYENSLELVKEDLIDPCKITKDDIHLEVYAKNVGLIFRKDLDVVYNENNCDENRLTKFGVLVEQKLIEYTNVQ